MTIKKLIRSFPKILHAWLLITLSLSGCASKGTFEISPTGATARVVTPIQTPATTTETMNVPTVVFTEAAANPLPTLGTENLSLFVCEGISFDDRQIMMVSLAIAEAHIASLGLDAGPANVYFCDDLDVIAEQYVQNNGGQLSLVKDQWGRDQQWEEAKYRQIFIYAGEGWDPLPVWWKMVSFIHERLHNLQYALYGKDFRTNEVGGTFWVEGIPEAITSVVFSEYDLEAPFDATETEFHGIDRKGLINPCQVVSYEDFGQPNANKSSVLAVFKFRDWYGETSIW